MTAAMPSLVQCRVFCHRQRQRHRVARRQSHRRQCQRHCCRIRMHRLTVSRHQNAVTMASRRVSCVRPDRTQERQETWRQQNRAGQVHRDFLGNASVTDRPIQ